MKKKILVFLLVGVTIFCGGCKAKEKEASTVMEKIQKQLNEMEDYYCTATLTRISNKGQNTYETKQYFKNTGEYRLELTAPETVAGNYTVYDGKTICQYNPRVGGKIIMDVPEDQGRNELFLGQFVKNYMQSEDVSIASASMDESKCTVLEAVIPGNNKYLSTEKLWMDNSTIKPVQFVIYDSNGQERYIIEYHEFEFDAKPDESLFQVQK